MLHCCSFCSVSHNIQWYWCSSRVSFVLVILLKIRFSDKISPSSIYNLVVFSRPTVLVHMPFCVCSLTTEIHCVSGPLAGAGLLYTFSLKTRSGWRCILNSFWGWWPLDPLCHMQMEGHLAFPKVNSVLQGFSCCVQDLLFGLTFKLLN